MIQFILWNRLVIRQLPFYLTEEEWKRVEEYIDRGEAPPCPIP